MNPEGFISPDSFYSNNAEAFNVGPEIRWRRLKNSFDQATDDVLKNPEARRKAWRKFGQLGGQKRPETASCVFTGGKNFPSQTQLVAYEKVRFLSHRQERTYFFQFLRFWHAACSNQYWSR
jgi:hypothetical protein